MGPSLPGAHPDPGQPDQPEYRALGAYWDITRDWAKGQPLTVTLSAPRDGS